MLSFLRHLSKRATVITAVVLPMVSARAQGLSSGLTCGQPTPMPVALTLSGGVSLGSHQAGFLYYSSLVFRENPNVFQPMLMTGASAGGLNTLLSILAFCGSPSNHISDSALWRGWVDLKLSDLIETSGAGPQALLSRTAFEKAVSSIEREWNKGLPKSCDFIVGITATRLEPRRTLDQTNLGFGRQDEKFSLRITGRGAGLPPAISNYVNPISGGRQTLLDLEPSNDKQNFAAFRDLLLATSSFPLAFAPQKIRYCLTNGSDPRWLHANYPLSCQPNEVETADFLDGGLIDNKPLGLAERMSRSGIETRPCGVSQIREIPMPLFSAPRGNRGVFHLLSDTGAKAYRDEGQRGQNEGALDVLGVFVGGWKDSVRSRDSVVALEEDPQLAVQVASAQNKFPRMGEPILGFFGFFESDFRAFDFYLGMAEARAFFSGELARSLTRGGVPLASQLRLPEMKGGGNWDQFNCVDETLKGVSSSKACATQENLNLEILAKLSLERLKRFQANEPPKNTIKGEDLDFIFKYLAHHRFEYRDLGLSRARSGEGAGKIKSVSLRVISRLADAQPLGESFVTRAALPVALSSVAKLPTERYSFVTAGPATRLGISIQNAGDDYPPWTRFAFGGQVESLQGWLSKGGDRVVFSPWVGFEFEPSAWNTAFVQTRLAFNGGYRFATAPSPANGDDCPLNSHSPVECRGFFVQAGVSTSLMERVRLELLAEAMPFVRSGAIPIQALPGIGLQFYF